MRYLIDTHVLLWYIKGDNRLKSKYIEIIDDADTEILVSSVSLWEIALKISIGKLELNTDYKNFINFFTERDFSILDFDSEDLNTMINLPFHHQDPFDRLIIAQSITKNLSLISDDNKFKKYDAKLI